MYCVLVRDSGEQFLPAENPGVVQRGGLLGLLLPVSNFFFLFFLSI